MPKVSVYLPDALYRQAQQQGLSLSALTQKAVERALRESSNKDWIARVQSRKARFHDVIDSAELLRQVRDEFGK